MQSNILTSSIYINTSYGNDTLTKFFSKHVNDFFTHFIKCTENSNYLCIQINVNKYISVVLVSSNFDFIPVYNALLICGDQIGFLYDWAISYALQKIPSNVCNLSPLWRSPCLAMDTRKWTEFAPIYSYNSPHRGPERRCSKYLLFSNLTNVHPSLFRFIQSCKYKYRQPTHR